MTANQFRKMALALPGVVEAEHMKHPDFRVKGKIFATLGFPDEDWGMVKLPPAEQRRLVESEPWIFKACAGAWGRAGCTHVLLESVSVAMAKGAIRAAFLNLEGKLKLKGGKASEKKVGTA